MLLGFISLLLTVTQNAITKICVPQSWTHHMLPCSFEEKEHEESKLSSTKHFQTFFSSNDVFDTARRLLGETNDHPSTEENHGYCASKVLKLNI
jgi:mlo protein